MYGASTSSVGGDSQTQTYNEACATLQNLNRLELQKLMDDSDALNRLIDDMAIVKKLEREKEALLVSNASLAEYNLSLEPRLISSRQELSDVYKKAVDLQKQHERYLLRLDSCAMNTSPETTLALLQTELAKVEEESEKLSERFSANGKNSDVEAFVTQYTNLRSLAHLRRIKVDKLTEMLREPQQHRGETAVCMSSVAAAVPAIPQRSAPHAPYGGMPYPQAPPVSGAAPPHGWPQAAPYPPIGGAAVNGWGSGYGGAPPYAAQPMPHAVSYMR